MHFSEGGDSQSAGGSVRVRPGAWTTSPETGQVGLPDATLQTIINADPIEKWYTIDPEPIAR